MKKKISLTLPEAVLKVLSAWQKSNSETWAPIFTENAEYILEVIDVYIEKMNRSRKMIADKDKEGLKTLMEEANAIQKILQ